MKATPTKKAQIRIAVVESDPLRFVGFRALFDSEPDFELVSASLPDIAVMQDIDLVLLGNRNGQNLFDVMASLKASRPDEPHESLDDPDTSESVSALDRAPGAGTQACARSGELVPMSGLPH